MRFMKSHGVEWFTSHCRVWRIRLSIKRISSQVYALAVVFANSSMRLTYTSSYLDAMYSDATASSCNSFSQILGCFMSYKSVSMIARLLVRLWHLYSDDTSCSQSIKMDLFQFLTSACLSSLNCLRSGWLFSFLWRSTSYSSLYLTW
jgi:hypothetical protein